MYNMDSSNVTGLLNTLNKNPYEELRCSRWGLEGSFGTAKSAHGLRKTPYHGLSNPSFRDLIRKRVSHFED